ncbi:hypothetical protein PHYBOEH_000776 [Phytophthora boehmeriae]|uniref:WW domain-containing protein n=1 Tax=Phytophthora boehmeriae TaxID=109152 RepID=A0A8T1WTI0_9STRA|nr:hypothetical protein PHYBOEH_000776 [Phytophthora boehmeriae]
MKSDPSRALISADSFDERLRNVFSFRAAIPVLNEYLSSIQIDDDDPGFVLSWDLDNLNAFVVAANAQNPARAPDAAFGWQLFHDKQRNLVYYLHNYTGEVRWPRPETVGFVMHGLKPLPACTDVGATTDSSVVNPDIWNPYYPHVVMLPSGLVQVHPGAGSDVRGATEIWCGYNRFPLAHFGTIADRGVCTGVSGTVEKRNGETIAPGTRMLPPTWEESRSGSPFLPPYPVAILGRGAKEEQEASAPLQNLNEQFHTPEVEAPRTYSQYQRGEIKLERMQTSMSWPMLSRESTINSSTPPFATTGGSTCKQSDYPQPPVAPRNERKEHNRKGYLLRQARRMMRYNTNSTGAESKQLEPQEAPTGKTRHELSRGKQNDFKDESKQVPPECS